MHYDDFFKEQYERILRKLDKSQAILSIADNYRRKYLWTTPSLWN
jgi:hypothetical protein